MMGTFPYDQLVLIVLSGAGNTIESNSIDGLQIKPTGATDSIFHPQDPSGSTPHHPPQTLMLMAASD